jgi:3-oxoacyl-[acyl-carrier-protein] synthase II
MKRVVITGIGAITPLAATFLDSWLLLKKGVSGVRMLSLPRGNTDRNYGRWKAAGQVRGLDISPVFTKKEQNFIDPFVLYAVVAAMEAAENAGVLNSSKCSENPGAIIVGSSRGGITTLEKEVLKISGRYRPSAYLMPTTTISAAAAYIVAKLKITAAALGISNACASGASAIGEAFRMIQSGNYSMILAGGSEAPVCSICIEGYGSARALSESPHNIASRPFDMERDGFVLAEGACMLLMEEMGSALRRNAKIIAEIVGYGNVCNAFHPTLPSEKGAAMAIKAVLADAKISPDDVGYINAHGTSTVAGDRAEASAIKKIFGARQIPVSSVKSMTGHMLGASGAFEVACTAMSLNESFITPTINTRSIDPECAVNVITEGMYCPVDLALSNSFGFGGINAVLALRRFKV